MFHAQMHANHHLRLNTKGRKAVHIPCKFRARKNRRFFYAHKLTVSFIYQSFVLYFTSCTKSMVFAILSIIRSCFLLIKSHLYIFFLKNISRPLIDISAKLDLLVYSVYFYLKKYTKKYIKLFA